MPRKPAEKKIEPVEKPKKTKKSNKIQSKVVEAIAAEEAIQLPSAPEEEKRKFEYKRLSASMMKTWMQCKRKFHAHYVEGIKSPANTSFTLGTSCHYALELANRLLREEGIRELNPVEIADFVQSFRDMAASLHVTDLALFDTGEELVQGELETYSLSEPVIGVEEEFDLVTPEGVRIYGFIDKLTEVNDTTIRITDYKTSVSEMSYEDAKTDAQLSMYDLAVKMKYPQYENRILELRYLRTRNSVTSYRSDIESNNFRKLLLSTDRAIKEYLANIEDTSKYPAGEMNDLCNWCGHKNQCPEYVRSANTLLPAAPSTLELTDDKFIEYYEKASAIYKAAEAWKDALKVWAAGRLEDDPVHKITNGELEINMFSGSRREYDTAKVAKAIGLPDLLGKTTGSSLIKIVNKNLEQYVKVKNDPKIAEKIEKAVSVKFNSPQIRLVKAKGNAKVKAPKESK